MIRKLLLFALLVFMADVAVLAQIHAPLKDYPHLRPVGKGIQYCDNDQGNPRKDTDHACECERTGRGKTGKDFECGKDEPSKLGMSEWCTMRCKPSACKCYNEKCS